LATSNWSTLGSIELRNRDGQSKTLHTNNGVPFPPFTKLEIATYSGDSGFYLLHICSDGQVADTYHESLEDAFHQAEYEFGVKQTEWSMQADGRGLLDFLLSAPKVEPDENDRL
jgi:predicted heme/steroid binding protein